jgi:hypothetical protein
MGALHMILFFLFSPIPWLAEITEAEHNPKISKKTVSDLVC